MSRPQKKTVDSINPVIRSLPYVAPDASRTRKQLKLTKAHGGLIVITFLSGLLILFITKARSVEVQGIESNLHQPGQFSPLNVDVSFHSFVKLPLGNRTLLWPGEHHVSVSAPGYSPVEHSLLVSGDTSQLVELELVRRPGSLSINIQSEGRELVSNAPEVRIDGQIKELESGTINRIAAGMRELTIDAPLYRPRSQTVFINGKGQAQSLTVDLEPAWAEYSIRSSPSGATVMVDGDAQGVTPIRLKIEEGRHTVMIQADDFKPYEQTLGVIAGVDLDIPEIQLTPADGVLNLSSTPSGAAVILNKEYRGTTPITLALTPNTSQHIKLYKAGYQIYANTVAVPAAKTVNESIGLDPDIIAVKISVQPNDALVFVDGKAQGQGRQTLTLSALPHAVSVRKPGYVTQTTNVIPTRFNQQIISVNLLTHEQHYWAQIPTKYTSSAGHEMRLFKDLGNVKMGSSRREKGRRSNEVVYQARLTKPFYVASTETTNKQYRAYKSAHNSGNYKAKSLDAQKAPVANVSWQNAARYCNWLSKKEGYDPFYTTTKGFISGHNQEANGYRLLTEVEWAWLARNKADHVLMYPWGTDKTPNRKIGNYADTQAASILTFTLDGYDDGFKGPAPVGRFEPNHRQIYDLDGNVSEWVHDWYSPKGNSELDGEASLVDPLGPEIGEFHVVRGGSWAKGYLPQLRLAYRDYAAKGKHDIGFRIARYAGLNNAPVLKTPLLEGQP